MQMDTPVFALDQVVVRRGRAVLLDGVSCQIPAGTCTALVGPSGAGKSTLLRVLNRLEEPAAGSVRFGGRPVRDLEVLALHRRVGLVGQAPVLLAGRVLDDLRVGRPGLDEDQALALLERVGLPASMLSRGTAGLSGGEAQRVCVAQVGQGPSQYGTQTLDLRRADRSAPSSPRRPAAPASTPDSRPPTADDPYGSALAARTPAARQINGQTLCQPGHRR
jgi:hypothetical protein